MEQNTHEFETIETASGKKFKVKLTKWVAMLLGYDTPRQMTEAELKLGNDSGYGNAILNPSDIYDEEKSKKVAIRKALDGMNLTKEDRQEFWEALFKFQDQRKAKDGLEAIIQYQKKYGENLLPQLELTFTNEQLEEAGEEAGYHLISKDAAVAVLESLGIKFKIKE